MVHIKFTAILLCVALAAVQGTDVAATTPYPVAAAAPTTGSTAAITNKKARGEIAAGGQIAFNSKTSAQGGFKAGGEINKFNGATPSNVGMGAGVVTGPVDGWKAQGEIGAGGHIDRPTGKVAEGGFKASGDIGKYTGTGASGQAVVGKEAKGGIAAGGEIELQKVKAKGGFAAHGELLSLTGASAPVDGGRPNPHASKSDVLAAQGIDTTFGEGKYYRRSLRVEA